MNYKEEVTTLLEDIDVAKQKVKRLNAEEAERILANVGDKSEDENGNPVSVIEFTDGDSVTDEDSDVTYIPQNVMQVDEDDDTKIYIGYYKEYEDELYSIEIENLPLSVQTRVVFMLREYERFSL